ncbi:hypothetical protein I553_10312 [Mycobacterium xenopi 4042]|uniref:Uncharacterized protein n=1 Tax=Mycobacterium xenopi 4042 TaxID=1299334 RepID=X7ZHV0_MYCXE|nr:hypothetical protein I553_10312 [Mycobacterium xenopi 4042]
MGPPRLLPRSAQVVCLPCAHYGAGNRLGGVSCGRLAAAKLPA